MEFALLVDQRGGLGDGLGVVVAGGEQLSVLLAGGEESRQVYGAAGPVPRKGGFPSCQEHAVEAEGVLAEGCCLGLAVPGSGRTSVGGGQVVQCGQSRRMIGAMLVV